MEDLDALAGAIAYKHTDDGKPNSMPLTIVTASVDRIDWLKTLDVCDLRLSGHVTYVGYSSMESKSPLSVGEQQLCNIVAYLQIVDVNFCS